MYPQLMNQASRLAPLLSRVLSRGGSFATPFWKATQVDAPEVNATPLTNPMTGKPLGQAGPSVPISDTQYPARDPSADGLPAPASMGRGPLTPASGDQASPLDTMQWPFGPLGAPSQAPASAAGAGVPLPTARPAEAPQAPQDTGFFMRNALMMQDPMGGGLIDPTGAASVSGPDLINKMMGYLHRKV